METPVPPNASQGIEKGFTAWSAPQTSHTGMGFLLKSALLPCLPDLGWGAVVPPNLKFPVLPWSNGDSAESYPSLLRFSVSISNDNAINSLGEEIESPWR